MEVTAPVLNDRDMLIFILLLVAVIAINAFAIPATLRLILFILIVAAQVLFVYHGLKRSRR